MSYYYYTALLSLSISDEHRAKLRSVDAGRVITTGILESREASIFVELNSKARDFLSTLRRDNDKW